MLFVFWGISYKTKKKYTYLYFIYYKHDRHVAKNQIRSYILIILGVFRCSLNVINSLAYGNSSKRILVFIFRFYYYIVLFAHIMTVMSPIITYPLVHCAWSCVWRTVSSQSSHHPQEVLLAQFSLYVHKGGLKPDSFHLHCAWMWCGGSSSSSKSN